MSETESDGSEQKIAPDIDYSEYDPVHDLLTPDERRRITKEASNLSVGDSVRINNRARPLEVVPQEETELLEMAYQETVFLKGNGTEYRIKIGNHAIPEMDRGEFTDSEWVAFISISDSRNNSSDDTDANPTGGDSDAE